tara:strand:- start:346 stop:585 length:240 start_codon:yes stop_codon:yes gene_type:complete
MKFTTKYFDIAKRRIEQLMETGEIKLFHAGVENGSRVIHIETDQGWNPEPFHNDNWYWDMEDDLPCDEWKREYEVNRER